MFGRERERERGEGEGGEGGNKGQGEWVRDRNERESDVQIFVIQITLQIFVCQDNPIRHVHQSAFQGVLALKVLRLQSHQLQQLPLLNDVGHSLSVLYISFAIEITSVRNQTYFDRYHNLRKLYMTKTSLNSTPMGLNHISTTIKRLSLMYNAITSVASMEYVNFSQLDQLDLGNNRITHLSPDAFITPKLQILDLKYNLIATLGDVTQYSWGNALAEYEYMLIDLSGNHWNCNASMNWIHSHLYKLQLKRTEAIIYAKPPVKPYVMNVDEMICHSPSDLCGTTLVAPDVLVGISKAVRSLSELAGGWSLN